MAKSHSNTKKDTFYFFSHDCNARNDPKILAIISRYGMEGYGRYWVLIEMMREQSNYKLIANAWLWDSIATAIRCDVAEAERFVRDCVDIGLFVLDEHLYSSSLLRRMETFEDTKEKRSHAGKKGAESRWNSDTIANVSQTDGKAIAKDGKENKIKENKKDDIYTPTREEENKLSENSQAEADEIISFVSDEFKQPVNSVESDILNDWVRHYPLDWIINAAKVAEDYEAKGSIKYADTTMCGWLSNGYTTKDKPWEVKNRGQPLSGVSGKVKKQNRDYSEYDK